MAVVVATGSADDGRRRTAGREAPPPSSSLEYFQNVVEEEQTFLLAPCGCDCWYCPDCCVRKGYNLRAELIPVLETFTGIMMLTLTVDPELFASPRAAYLYVREKRGISELMRRLHDGGHLHSRRYFYVVEFQQHTEQAHFHVLIDASFVPKGAIDEAWSRLRPAAAGPVAANRPAFGMARFSVREFGGPLHAARYATKYLVKTPESGWPSWVLAMGSDRRVPRYGTSRGFWNRERRPSNPTGRTRTCEPRTYAERIEDCGVTSNLFEVAETIDVETGEVIGRVRWLARLGVDDELLQSFMPDGGGGRVVELIATGPQACMEAIQRAAGHPVAVIATGRAAE